MKDIFIRDVGPSQLKETAGVSASKESDSRSFAETLKDSLKEVNNLQLHADKAVQEMAMGESRNLHDTMILLEKADISFRLMMQVRNKLMEAYHEIMRMQI
ncbi:MAG: flagellar hook-basal body complex protein FliE [Deltaproteobacteria bacterium]|nr:flagellar hook-basal body complex protein FliE [Deltaproteobacteria bacterium]MBW2305574.1 flagellar hook-basal body complex protein FliE [Deltaproteobacteria bacterium]